MKKSILAAVILCISITSANAQWWSSDKSIKGNGNVVTENRKTSDYDAVSLVGFMDVALVKGSEGNLTIQAESNLQEYITTEVKNGTLRISVEKGVNISPSRHKSIKVTVPFEDLEGAYLTGSGDIWTEDKITARDFSLSVTGSGDMNIEIEADEIDGKVTGSGDTQLIGTASELDCNVTGSGDFDAYKLRAAVVSAQVSGSGDIMVYAEKELNARIAGSGDISYKGNPSKENFKTSGSGDISKY
ncbi:Putative auto-transporter adhesin, head GIN domain [Zunongwangia mangrovi]|uniref:Putative auto-transporter adhesin, head GIN domain n=1 Tax=Zunongwangia mangrovi TaxID=1334022 RepID=A0A1I1M3F9_9FLAO|nr:head GIN domain-containing protein [Zunongwangia mangrovi]SFC80057.1 Putative auto-transporter adhesin, head GIN domain [Zunongwangia mangrovi]